MVSTIFTSEITTINTSAGAKTVTFSKLDSMIELLMYNTSISITKVTVTLTYLDQSKVVWTGPALAGLLPAGYVEKKKGGAAETWNKVKAAKLNGLEIVPSVGSAQAQTVLLEFSPSNGRIFEMNEKIEPVLVVALPHVAKAAGETAEIDVIAVLCNIHVTM